MAEAGGLASLTLLAAALLGPAAVLIGGHRVTKWPLVVLFISGTVALPLSAASDPPDFRGATLIIAAIVFVVGLVAINIAGAIRAPRRGR